MPPRNPADRPATEPRTEINKSWTVGRPNAQYFDPLAVMVGQFARDFVEPERRMDAIDRLYSMLNEARAEAAQGADLARSLSRPSDERVPESEEPR